MLITAHLLERQITLRKRHFYNKPLSLYWGSGFAGHVNMANKLLLQSLHPPIAVNLSQHLPIICSTKRREWPACGVANDAPLKTAQLIVTFFYFLLFFIFAFCDSFFFPLINDVHVLYLYRRFRSFALPFSCFIILSLFSSVSISVLCFIISYRFFMPLRVFGCSTYQIK